MTSLKNFLFALAAVALLALPARADLANGFPQQQSLTTNIIYLTAGQITNLPTPVFCGDKGFALWPYFAGTNAGTANLTIFVYPSYDGTNGTSTASQISAVAMNGTVGVRGYVLVPPTTVNHERWCYISLTNAHTGSLYITNVTATSWR